MYYDFLRQDKDRNGEFALNQCIDEWVSNGLHSFQPSKAIAIQALPHLSKKKRADLSSKNEIPKQIAFGQLYEAVIYCLYNVEIYDCLEDRVPIFPFWDSVYERFEQLACGES